MANQNLSQFGEKLFVADADHTFIWDTAASISKRVSRNSWLSGTTADFHLGLADAATAVAQTISVQSVVAGTSNTAGANLSINGSQGTGTGAGGSLLLRTAPAGSSGTAQNALVTAVAITSAGNVGIGTTSPTSKLHVEGNSSPTITLKNTLATGYGQLLFQNTVVSGTGFWLNGSTQTGYGGANSLNTYSSDGPIAFHTATVTNALSIAQSGAATFANNVFLNGYIQIANADGRLSFDGGSKVFYTAANTYIQDLYRRAGSGDPNGTVTAPVGATYNRTDGGAGTSFYVKESGTGNTGWVGK